MAIYSLDKGSNYDSTGQILKNFIQNNLKGETQIRIEDNSYIGTITNMYGIFKECSNLVYLNLNNLNTSQVTNMYGMCGFCENLKNFSVNDTSNVTDMSDMFSECYNLTVVPNFNTSKVTDMSFMFSDTDHLTSIGDYDTSRVTNMCCMFQSTNLTWVPSIDYINVTDLDSMCLGAKIQAFGAPKSYPRNNNVNMSNMFKYCNNLFQNAVNNIVKLCANTNAINKNWTNLGFNLTYNGGQFNAYIRTANDYVAAVENGWTNIGPVIFTP